MFFCESRVLILLSLLNNHEPKEQSQLTARKHAAARSAQERLIEHVDAFDQRFGARDHSIVPRQHSTD
jgi:hypothetical protein